MQGEGKGTRAGCEAAGRVGKGKQQVELDEVARPLAESSGWHMNRARVTPSRCTFCLFDVNYLLLLHVNLC
jgi:hypothetical protein